MLAGFAIGGLFVALQYFFIFRSLYVTAAAALLAGVSAGVLAKNTLRGVETNVIHNLHVIAAGRGRMFRELEEETE